MQIKQVLDNHNESWLSVAKKLGNTSSALIQVSKGNPTIGKLKSIAGAIGCHWIDFFADELEADGLKVVKAESPEQKPEESAQQGAADELPFEKQGPEHNAEGEKVVQAEEKKILQFGYQCPHCGHQVRITID